MCGESICQEEKKEPSEEKRETSDDKECPFHNSKQCMCMCVPSVLFVVGIA
jgi:hypothetical protein